MDVKYMDEMPHAWIETQENFGKVPSTWMSDWFMHYKDHEISNKWEDVNQCLIETKNNSKKNHLKISVVETG
jgi:Sec7-like guanine-nucleotide exchange factor